MFNNQTKTGQNNTSTHSHVSELNFPTYCPKLVAVTPLSALTARYPGPPRSVRRPRRLAQRRSAGSRSRTTRSHSFVFMRGWRVHSARLSRPHCSQRSFSTTPLAHTHATRVALQAADKSDKNAFGKTLRLPQTNFPLYRDTEREQLLKTRTCEDLYNWQVRLAVLPRSCPQNVNRSLLK